MVPIRIDYDLNLLVTDKTRLINITDIDFLPVSSSLSEKLNINFTNLCKYNNWFLYNDDYYYLKQRDQITVVMRELVGVELSNYMQLPTIEYTLASCEEKIVGLASKNFHKPGIEYFKSTQSTKIERIKRELALYVPLLFSEEYARFLARYILRNYFACQKDRIINVEYFKIKHKEFISELFDYEISFYLENFKEYVDCLFYNEIDDKSLLKMMKFNEYLQEYFEYILEFDIEKVLNNIENDHQIIIPDCVSEEFITFVQKRKNSLKYAFGYRK